MKSRHGETFSNLNISNSMTPYQAFPKELQCFPSQQCTSDYKRCNALFKNWISVVRIIRRLHFFVKILCLCKWFPHPQVIFNFSTWVHCSGCCFSRNVFNIVVCAKALRQYLNFTPENFISVNDASETPLIELQHPDSTQIWVNKGDHQNRHFQTRYLTI